MSVSIDEARNIRDVLRRDMYCRDEWPGDREVIQEVLAYRYLKFENRTVLDVGGGIGSFSLFAFHAGAERVITVEADPGNVQSIQVNLAGRNAVIYHNAVYNENGLMINFYRAKKRSNIHTIVPKHGREVIAVPTVSLTWLIEQFQPSTVKIDVEGAEHYFLPGYIFPPCVDSLAIEFHSIPRQQLTPDQMADLIEQQGFKPVHRKNEIRSLALVTFER